MIGNAGIEGHGIINKTRTKTSPSQKRPIINNEYCTPSPCLPARQPLQVPLLRSEAPPRILGILSSILVINDFLSFFSFFLLFLFEVLKQECNVFIYLFLVGKGNLTCSCLHPYSTPSTPPRSYSLTSSSYHHTFQAPLRANLLSPCPSLSQLYHPHYPSPSSLFF